jgi:hypothetical protein
MKVKNHIREIPTEDLKLVAIAWQDIDGDQECGFSAIVRHDAFPGSEAEYNLWCNTQSVDTAWSCSICGHSLKYNCVVQHTSTGLFYDIGRDCCENLTLLKDTLPWLDSKQASAAKCVAAGKKAQKARTAGDVREAEFAIAKPEIAAAFTYAKAFPNNHAIWHKVAWNITTLRDLRSKVRQHGSLSEKQEAFSLSLHKQAEEIIVSCAEEVIKRVKAIESGVRSPEGKQTISGVIASIKWVDNDFGGAFKCLINLDNGTKCYGTLPTTQHETSENINNAWVKFQAEKDDKVTFTASFEVSQKDPLFSFYKRPTKFVNNDLDSRVAKAHEIKTAA